MCPFFSIIIPTFNSEATLHKCITSIITQTFEDYEVLIIDGVSKDNTLSIAGEFNDPRVKIISEPDKGIYDAMNKGIKLAHGEWLYFLGSDDKLYESNVLQNLYNYLDAFECQVLYGDVISSRFNGRYDGEFTRDKIFNKNICHQAILFKNIVFKKTGFFNLKYKCLADWDHNIKWFLNNEIAVKYIDLIIAEYSDNGFSSLNSDEIFLNDKRYNFIFYGWKSAPKLKLLRLCKQEIKSKNTSLLRKINILFMSLLIVSRISLK